MNKHNIGDIVLYVDERKFFADMLGMVIGEDGIGYRSFKIIWFYNLQIDSWSEGEVIKMKENFRKASV